MGTQQQATSDHIHYVTEKLYKDLNDAFAPRLKTFLQTGRAYQKALSSVTATAKAHIDSITSLGRAAEQANGAANDIGSAFLQLAEVYREIQKQIEENLKAVTRDLLIPLETKQDSEFKNLSFEHKKYANGHKLLVSSYDKATSNLKKVRRKNKTKGFGQDAKEMQCLRLADECRTKMDSFRLRGLKKVMLEERKRYSFVLDRMCCMVRAYATHHSKSQEMLSHRLVEWTALYKDPTQLPENARNLLAISNENPEDHHQNNSITDLRQTKLDTLHREPADQHTYDRLANGRPRSMTDITETRSNGTGTTLPRSITVPPPAPPAQQPHVRALYDHVTTAETQLSFNGGDIIRLIGDKKDGWHYGENIKVHKMGWFPLSFTEPFDTNQKSLSQRAKSMIDLVDGPDDDIITVLPPANPVLGFHGYGSVDPRSRTMPTTRPMIRQEPAQAEDSRNYSLQRQNSQQSPPPPPPPPQTLPPSITMTSANQGHPPPSTAAMDDRSMYASSPVHMPYNGLPPPPPPFDNPGARGNHYSQSPARQHGSHYAESQLVPGASPYASVNVNSSHGLPRYVESPMAVTSVPSPPLPPPPPPVADYDEEDMSNNMFANVKLKKAATNDRSAPRIH